MILRELIDNFGRLSFGLTLLGRVRSLEVICVGEISQKRDKAELAYQYFLLAQNIDMFLQKYFQVRPSTIAWSVPAHAEIKALLEASVDQQQERIRNLFDNIMVAVQQVLKALLSAVRTSPLLRPAEKLLERICLDLPMNERHVSTPGSMKILERPREEKHCVFSLCGPRHAAIDSRFLPTYSLLEKPVPQFGDSAEEVVPYFWSLAIRESLAAELCALSSVEYDSMPLQFYLDMSKQSWDEMRHSIYFFDLAIDLLSELESCTTNQELLKNIQSFRLNGKGLPIPKEKNLYEAILDATLVERLILLHRDTETPGILRIKKKITSPFCLAHPSIAEGLEVVLRDEVTHTQFGHRWLEYLVPNELERNSVIEETELLRGVLLLSSFAQHGSGSLSNLMSKYISGAVAPNSNSPLPANALLM